jgi:putative ABC transport system ATP-binding protein
MPGIQGDERPLFTFEAVTVAGVSRPRLDGATGRVPDCGISVIVGPSGSGKSTLLRCCNRLEVPTSGRVLLWGEDVAGLDPLPLRRRVGMVFQRPSPFPGSVLENLQIAEPGLTENAAAGILDAVGLDAAFLVRPATELSGGESQRLCFARTLVTEPEVVLLDEVTASVDPAARLGLEALGRELADRGVRVVWVTHDLDQMRRLAAHVVVLIAGRIAFGGTLERLDDAGTPDVRRFLAAIAADKEMEDE